MIYGLDTDSDAVRGEVFARKISTLVRALQAADKHVNGGKRHELLVEDLEKHSAKVKLREKVSSRLRVRGTGSAELGRAFALVYQGGPKTAEIPRNILGLVNQLASGAETKFSHAEAIYANNNVIRIDKFFISQAESAQHEALSAAEQEMEARFIGSSRDQFDGTLKVIDTRGQLVRAILTLTAGGKSIDCVLRRDLLDQALNKFEVRVSVEGTAIYTGKDYLPRRMEVERIRKIGDGAAFSDWRGKLKIPNDFDFGAWPDSFH